MLSNAVELSSECMFNRGTVIIKCEEQTWLPVNA